ncbi:MAG TPA: hypothetical protein ENI22_01515 [Candidatus Pacearchaeota archaeon]|nr:hypothetical protein [Candidatus Pacearchaeota archaeon]
MKIYNTLRDFGREFSNNLKYSNRRLKNSGFNLRERLNVYSGMVGGVLAPVFLTRYGAFEVASTSIKEEAFKWAFSLPTLIFSPFGLVAGAALGTSSAMTNRLVRERKERNQKLENLVGNFKSE